MTAANVPEKPALEGLETKWGGSWEETGTYRFDRDSATRESIFSIDTPPPTASGSLHIGHVCHRPLPADARQERLLPDGLG
jgi:valyl-tRNA synthetase